MDDSKKTLCKCLVAFLAFLGVLSFLLWFALKPRSPSFSILFISLDGNKSTISFNLEIRNPNKDSSIFYDETTLTFLYGQDQYKVGEITIGSFHQGIKKTRDVSQVVNAQPGALKPLLNDISNATAELNVILMTRIRYTTFGVFKSKFHGLNLNDILPIDSNGKLSGNNNKYLLGRRS
ncbi:hypothetical protein RIF29_37696 [Crotalaria pallida]|uniref:Late embryogenesis abundant protein LEA-2 subgroup domain-containing protein n=1 Tax=Crotalaria pallida TaxID=3830 RepID=A0AAN9EEV6_CROPI